MIYLLDFRGAEVGGAVLPGTLSLVQPNPKWNRQTKRYTQGSTVRVGVKLGTEDDLRRETKVTFLFHGFNVNRSEGREGLIRLAQNLPAVQDGGIVAVLWPGDAWSGALCYSFQGTDADDSAAALARFIDLYVRPGAELNFVSHSLGARVAMETIKRLQGGRWELGRACLMAPAIDDFGVSNSKIYRGPAEAVKRLGVLASKKDPVLKLAYPVGDLLQAFLYIGKDVAGLALGYHGPRPAGTEQIPEQIYSWQIDEGRDCDHGGYVPDSSMTRNQKSATTFANAILKGERSPEYK